MRSGVSGSLERRSSDQVPSSLLWGVVSCKGAASTHVPRVRLSSSSTVSVFVCLRLRLPPSLSVSVVAPGGWSRGRRLFVRCSTLRRWNSLWRACSKFVWCFVELGTGELIVKSLCCVVMSSQQLNGIAEWCKTGL